MYSKYYHVFIIILCIYNIILSIHNVCIHRASHVFLSTSRATLFPLSTHIQLIGKNSSNFEMMEMCEVGPSSTFETDTRV